MTGTPKKQNAETTVDLRQEKAASTKKSARFSALRDIEMASAALLFG